MTPPSLNFQSLSFRSRSNVSGAGGGGSLGQLVGEVGGMSMKKKKQIQEGKPTRAASHEMNNSLQHSSMVEVQHYTERKKLTKSD